MASNAKTLETGAAANHYSGLSDRNLLLCLVGIYAGTMTAQTAATGAAANKYAALSDRQLDQCLLDVLS